MTVYRILYFDRILSGTGTRVFLGSVKHLYSPSAKKNRLTAG